ncbi:MAG: motif family protein [Proteobacteria bacterium]|nr:motif family protein [Pseudomonadota bacterium]
MNSFNPTIRRFLTVSAMALALPLSALAQETASSAPAAKAGDVRRPLMAHGNHGIHHGSAGAAHGAMFALRGLDLSPAQREQVKALFDAQRPAFQEKSKAVHEARVALHQLSLSDKYTPERAAELAQDVAQKDSAQLLFMAEQGNKLAKILTPEQRSKMLERLQARAGKTERR